MRDMPVAHASKQMLARACLLDSREAWW